MLKVSKLEIAKMIDHSLLHPTMDDQTLKEGCELARKYNVASVCIKPYAVKMAVAMLQGSDVMVGTVIGFPHGNSRIDVKVFETEKALEDGAVEIDMVVNSGYGYTKQADGTYNYKGATPEDLILMRKHSAPEVEVKAAGGIRTLEDTLKVRELGVTRIGATATEAIILAVDGIEGGKTPDGY